MFKFIGTGSAFNTALGNTSCYIKKDSSMLLVDCGGTVYERLQKLNLLSNLKNLHVIITHTHPDHVGSLGEVIFYSHFILKIKPKLYFQDGPWIKGLFKYIGVQEQMYELVTDKSCTIEDSSLGNMELEFMPVEHEEGMPAFAFLMKYSGKNIYYSGDAKGIGRDILRLFNNDRIDMLYQDTCALDYDGNAHTSLKRLKEMIPHAMRDKVYCIHHDNTLSKYEVEEAGFNYVE
ncbi:MBL fold metallo-hydrolase [Clostridium sp. 19966]|uniref:MBL fold metallo-hydrolase n=1 Tax=Clostridium sp. 19966 TaxID=2768166 RepID=UPI0028DE78F1|nr:MBL fold metallo-hydrolase [Clostridium sp. 19966]MDT8718832.1 MBL fold metallo-hydrolase [Clostridium sp. 19966]